MTVIHRDISLIEKLAFFLSALCHCRSQFPGGFLFIWSDTEYQFHPFQKLIGVEFSKRNNRVVSSKPVRREINYSSNTFSPFIFLFVAHFLRKCGVKTLPEAPCRLRSKERWRYDRLDSQPRKRQGARFLLHFIKESILQHKYESRPHFPR